MEYRVSFNIMIKVVIWVWNVDLENNTLTNLLSTSLSLHWVITWTIVQSEMLNRTKGRALCE